MLSEASSEVLSWSWSKSCAGDGRLQVELRLSSAAIVANGLSHSDGIKCYASERLRMYDIATPFRVAFILLLYPGFSYETTSSPFYHQIY